MILTAVSPECASSPVAVAQQAPFHQDEGDMLINSLLTAVHDREAIVAAYYLGEAAAVVPAQDLPTRIWLPVLDALAQPAASCVRHPSAEMMDDMMACLALLRRQTRIFFKSGRATAATQWIVPEPNGAMLGTVAHVAAACLSLRGVDARPWLWPTAPIMGAWRIVTPAWHRNRRVSTPIPANNVDLTWDELVQTVRAHLHLFHQPLMKGTSC